MLPLILPIRIAFPTLAHCLLGPGVNVSSSVLVQTFLDSLSPHDASIIKRATEEVLLQQPVFSKDLMPSLLSILSHFHIRALSEPPNFRHMICQIASYEFCSKPSAALAAMFSGIPKQHRVFWRKMDVNNLLSIYYAQTVSPGTVLGMLEDAVGVNANEERIIGYLRQYVGNLNTDCLRNFLRFVTGSVVCSTLKIVVTFNSLSGAERRPIAHTCASSLELPIRHIWSSWKK